MKIFTKNAVIKKFLVILITVIMVSNFIMPNYVHAADASSGEKLVSSFFYLIAKLGDAALSAMQGMMTGDWSIRDNQDNFSIKYSPGLIFSNKIPALDANFIHPSEDTTKYEKDAPINFGETNKEMKWYTIYERAQPLYDLQTRTDWGGDSEYNDELKKLGFYHENSREIYIDDSKAEEKIPISDDLVTQIYTAAAIKTYKAKAWIYDDVVYILYGLQMRSPLLFASDVYFRAYATTLTSEEIGNLNNYYQANSQVTENASTASHLQKYISNWYVALRTIALVGLLSVLVYLGIKIIISSSSSQDKAKYKNMLKDWLVAICIIFMLHYIMAFLFGITQYVNEIINDEITSKTSGSIYTDGYTDELLNTVRTNVGKDLIGTMTDPNDHVIGHTIMYIALVILTGIFTVQYLKRVIYMAFLTMIAPLIGLTYPIDKIKDGQAQAFKYWLKEYIFNCLIQPIHLLLYTVLITNSINFAKENILYAIVALAFLVPAEKLIKEMFGMKSNSPSGTLGAAAGGAVVMSMLQKLRAKPPKEDAEGAGGKGPSGVRTATRTPGTNGNTTLNQNTVPNQNTVLNQNTAPNQNTTLNQNTVPNQNTPLNQNTVLNQNTAPNQNTPLNQNTTPNQNTILNQNTAPNQNTVLNQNTTPNQNTVPPTGASTTMVTPSIGRGLSALGKRYIGDVDTWKTRGKKFSRTTRRAIGGAALGTATATISLANEVADGHFFEDPSKAVSNIGLAAAGGYMAGSNLTGRAIKNGENISETYKQGYYGAEQYNNMKFDKEFFKSDGYKNIEQDATILSAFGGNTEAIKTATKEFLNNGITDSAKIREYMQHGITGNDAKDFSVVGIDKVADIEKLQAVGVNPTDYGMFSSAGFAKAQDIKDLKSAGIGASDIKHFASAGVKDANKILKAKDAHPNLSNKGLAEMFAIAKYAPKNNPDAFKKMMVGRKIEMEDANGLRLHTIEDADAEAIYRELADFF